MDQLKGALSSFGGGSNQNQQQQEGQQQGQQSGSGGGGFLGGFGDKLNSAAGGGKESEKNEDYLDKGEFFGTCDTSHDDDMDILLTQLLPFRCRFRSREVLGSRPTGQRECR